MKPRLKLSSTKTPEGGEVVLFSHDQDFIINVNGQDLMLSRHNESERDLAWLGCAHLVDHSEPQVLIGGLGMGYTLREALDLLAPQARVIVSELLDEVVQWNHKFLGELNDRPLKDERVEVKTGNIVELVLGAENSFDAILLDVDNGPGAITDSGNSRLYGPKGIRACRNALREDGLLAVWSAGPSKIFEERLMHSNFHVRRFRVFAYKGGKSQPRFVWVASRNPAILPPGGGEPRLPQKKSSDKPYKPFRKRR